jgi:hypothetical protein
VGTPTLPEPYAKLVQMPLEGRLIKVTRKKRTRYTLQFDKGQADGLQRRMLLTLEDGADSTEVFVDKVGTHWAEGTLEIYDRSERDRDTGERTVPVVGSTFTTCRACR